MAKRPNIKYRAIQTKVKNVSFVKSLLRSVGLKFLALQKRLSGIDLNGYGEQEQILINVSRKIASSRIAVHILPIFITLFVFSMNGIEILNGPQITTLSTFFLQVASKFHELTISGSLMVVVLDLIRYELLHEGLNLGLLVSSFSMVGLNFLWSTEMLSIFKASYTKRKRMWLFSVIAVCCSLTAVVGPASALLLVPDQTWKPYGWTEFYLGGGDADLWPTQLTAQHAGPKTCLQPGSMTATMCPAGGYQMVSARLQKDPDTGYTIYLQDAHYTRVMRGFMPRFNYSSDEQGTQESWTMSSRGDVTFMLQDLENVYRDAQAIAKGRSRRLRDFIDGWYQISESKFPVGRTVCGPSQWVHDDTKSLPFPVLQRDRKWRNISFGANQTQGRLIDHDISGLFNISTLAESAPVQARWIALGPEYGAATAGLIVLSGTASRVAGRACTLDYRWALGQTYRKQGGPSEVYETHIGRVNTPSNSQKSYEAPKYRDFLDPISTPFYSDTIKADQEWLNNVFPTYATANQLRAYNTTTFEAMISGTILNDPGMIMAAESQYAFLALSRLEYMAGVAFVDVLARTNWQMSLKYPDDSLMIKPALQQASGSLQRILTGAPIYRKPDNMTTTSLRVYWYTYGTAWTLHEPGQFIAVAILSAHMLIAVIHSVVTLKRGESMEAWDSITELILLAWNSQPTRRDIEFKNTSVGIHTMKTMAYKVKVAVVEDQSNQNSERVELIVVDEKARNVDGRVTHDVIPGDVYK